MKFAPLVHGLCFGLLTASVACAQEKDSALLLQPEAAFIASSSPASLALQVDGQPLSLTSPHILIHKTTDEADFISAEWRDASGQLTHQRDVLIIKPSYGVIVDYLYGKAQHEVTRSFTFPAGPVTPYAHGATASLSGKNAGVLVLDDSKVALAGNTVTFTSKVTTPVPITTILQNWSGSIAPVVDYVKPANPMIVKFNVKFPDRMDQIGVAWESRPLHLSGHELKGWAACLRQLSTGGESSFEIQ